MRTDMEPWWAMLVVWVIVNAVNVLQAAGFASRVMTGSRTINHALGYGIIVLAVPAIAAGVALRGAGWLAWLGPAVFVVFVVVMVWVDYVAPVEFRSPPMLGVMVPYLVLFFGSILLMGLPMFGANRGLWAVTAATTALHLGAMGWAMLRGVG